MGCFEHSSVDVKDYALVVMMAAWLDVLSGL
jgi:hypothetical protein